MGDDRDFVPASVEISGRSLTISSELGISVIDIPAGGKNIRKLCARAGKPTYEERLEEAKTTVYSKQGCPYPAQIKVRNSTNKGRKEFYLRIEPPEAEEVVEAVVNRLSELGVYTTDRE